MIMFAKEADKISLENLKRIIQKFIENTALRGGNSTSNIHTGNFKPDHLNDILDELTRKGYHYNYNGSISSLIISW